MQKIVSIYYKSRKGQTAMELAVFGGILIFVLGMIIRQGMSSGYQQNFQLRTLRQAMLTSCLFSGGCGTADTASRNSATVVLVEDRLTGSSAKYGGVDRMPLMSSATATHSHNLFYPVEDMETWNLPVMDVYVNGHHFQFTTARFIVWCMTKTLADCPAITDSLGNPIVWSAPADIYKWIGDKNDDGAVDSDFVYDDACYYVDYPAPTGRVYYGCAIVAGLVPNHPATGWDAGIDQRFDLDHDGSVDVPAAYRSEFSWQWDERRAFMTVKNSQAKLNTGRAAMGTKVNSSFDIDGDSKEEKLMKIVKTNASGAVLAVRVIDYQEGDVDFAQEGDGGKPKPGFKKDMQMYTLIRPRTGSGPGGTYALIEEGKLYGPGGQYIRTTRRKDQIDLIQREFQLTNNTGLLCDAAGSPVPGTGVEVCSFDRGGCFSATTSDKNCLDIGSMALFIRSRLVDRHGRKWVTDVGGDDYQDINVPAVP